MQHIVIPLCRVRRDGTLEIGGLTVSNGGVDISSNEAERDEAVRSYSEVVAGVALGHAARHP